jgi:octanoyl-[GcvH]:protein N-octanoyltransferase
MQVDGRAAIRRPRPLRLHRDQFPGEPLLDTAISHAMLRRVAGGSVGESLRLYAPDRALLFSSLDARRTGYRDALSLAERAGFPSVIRLAGGQAAVFLEKSIAFAWATPDPDAHLHIRPRFERVADWIKTSLCRLGLDARVGSVAGEYCPGEFSVNIGGRVKVMGVGQRVIHGGAHVGGVITVAETPLLRETLAPIYEALDIDFRPETAGGIADFDPSLGTADLMAAMLEVLCELGFELEPQRFDDSIRGEAESLIPIHEPGGRKAGDRVLRASPSEHKTLVQGGPPKPMVGTTETEDSS